MSFGFDMSVPVGHWVGTLELAQQWLEYFIASAKVRKVLGLDTETTGLHKFNDRVVVWSLSDGIQRICVPAKFLYLFKEPILENPEIEFDFTNAKFDGHMLANMGINVSRAGAWHDTLVQSWLFNENNQGRHGLKDCVIDYFGRVTPSFDETFGAAIPIRRHAKTKVITFPGVNKGDLVKMAFEFFDLTPKERLDKVLANPKSYGKVYGPANQKTRKLEDWAPEAVLKWEQVAIGATDYSSLDAYNSTKLREFFDDKLKDIIIDVASQRTMKDLFYENEVPFTKVLWKMERRGITVDYGYLLELNKPMESELDAIETEFNNYYTLVKAQEAAARGLLFVPQQMSLSKPATLREFFFDHLKRSPVNWTDGGQSGVKMPSLDYETFDTWAGEGCQWSLKMNRWRSVDKIKGTYVTGLPEHVNFPHDVRIHTSLNQIGAVTGRLSSSDPNLQNIPRPGKDIWNIRDAFIAGFGRRLLVADYAQLEMRLMAHYSGDEKMIDAIIKDIDLHCLTVSEMYGIAYKEVNDAKKAEKAVKNGSRKEPLTVREVQLLEYRQAAKATGFGIIYGIGGRGLASQLTQELGRLVTPEEAALLIRKWFSVFPGVEAYIEWIHQQMRQNGFVQNIMGYMRRFGDVRRMNRTDAARANRQGPNATIQGSAACVAKMSMLAVEKDEQLNAMDAELLLQIHDELIIDCPEEYVEIAKPIVKNIMENPFSYKLRVPLPVEIGSGLTWAQAK